MNEHAVSSQKLIKGPITVEDQTTSRIDLLNSNRSIKIMNPLLPENTITSRQNSRAKQYQTVIPSNDINIDFRGHVDQD